MIGLFAFFYGTLHLLTYVWFDQSLNLRSIVADVTQRRFILVGMTALLLMVPLAITSTDQMVKKLGGKDWLITARIQYGDKDITVPLMLPVEWAGDTPVITLTDLTIPGAGTFTARVLLYRGQYAGTWSAKDHGGEMFGKIVRR